MLWASVDVECRECGSECRWNGTPGMHRDGIAAIIDALAEAAELAMCDSCNGSLQDEPTMGDHHRFGIGHNVNVAVNGDITDEG